MSEDHSIKRNQKKKEESRSAPDFFGSLGKGMVPKENLETLGNSSGLTPLGFGVDVRNRIMDSVDVRNRIMDINPVSDGVSTTEFTENTEIFKDSSGLSPLRPFVKKHKKEVLE
ncbi:MAG: hypothetical protein Q8M95_00720 [Candidatus Methanoperedens sp.]|nr:hypothetical protein [Candidatus Methanoperedens sp.]